MGVVSIYTINLGVGNRWSIINVNVKNPWLNDFLQSAGFSPATKEEANRIVVVLTDGPSAVTADVLSGHDYIVQTTSLEWDTQAFPVFRFWRNKTVNTHILEMFPSCDDPLSIRDLLSYLCYLIYFSGMSSDRKGLPLHAACIERNDKAFLLLGDSGAGKSTACQRIVPPWRALSDEETLVVLDDQGNYQAHTFPNLCDFAIRKVFRSYDVQRSIPLAAIFFLKQHEVDKINEEAGACSALKIFKSSQDVFCRSFQYISDKVSHRRLQFDNAVQIAKKTPCFELSVAKEGTFWLEMEKVL